MTSARRGVEEAHVAYDEAEMMHEEVRMPYREKIAWLSLIAMAVTYGPYFAIVAAGILPAEALPNLRQLGLFAVAALGNALIQGVGRLVLGRLAPAEAHTPLD